MATVNASQSNVFVNIGQAISTIPKVEIIDYLANPYYLYYEGLVYKDGSPLDVYFYIYGDFDYTSDSTLYESKISSIYYSFEVLGELSLSGLDSKVEDFMYDPNNVWDNLLADNNTIIGSPHNDQISTKEGNDYIDAGAGNDSVDGGSGTDKVAFGGPSTSFKVTDRKSVV